MLEVATSFILEREFAWDAQAIGLGIACSFGTTLILGIFIIAVNQVSLVNQASVLTILVGVGPLASLFLFSSSWLRGSALQILVADSAIFASMFNACSLLEGFAINSTIEGTLYCKDNFLVAATVLSKIARFVGTSSGRAIVDHCHRNGYAAVQLSMAVLSCCTIIKVRPLLPNRDGLAE